MITTSNLGSVRYDFIDNQFELENNSDVTKKGQFDISQIPTSSIVILSFPSSSGTILTIGSNFNGYQTTLVNSTVIILDSKVKSTSQITVTYNSNDYLNQGDLSVSVNPFSSLTINSSKANDNNSISVIIIY